jgi:hypothetical protein
LVFKQLTKSWWLETKLLKIRFSVAVAAFFFSNFEKARENNHSHTHTNYKTEKTKKKTKSKQ